MLEMNIDNNIADEYFGGIPDTFFYCILIICCKCSLGENETIIIIIVVDLLLLLLLFKTIQNHIYLKS